MKTTSISIWYRRKASGVQTTLRNMCGTGEGLLGYELHSGACVVQEKGFWGTNYTLEHVWYRRKASGVRTALETCSVQEKGLWGTNRTPKRIRYWRRVSGVQTALRNVFGTGEGSLGYRTNPKRMQVQGRRNYKINDYNIN